MATHLAGKSRRDMRHSLFVTPLMNAKLATVLFQRLPQSNDVPVAKNGENPFYKFDFAAVYVDVLIIKKAHQSLRHGQPDCFHVPHLLLSTVRLSLPAYASLQPQKHRDLS